MCLTMNWLRRNWTTAAIFALALSFILYRRLPIYLEDRDLLGRPAPDFTLQTPAGDRVRLSDLRGKRVLLNFWGTWCWPCRLEVPMLTELYTEMRTQNFELLAVTAEGLAPVRKFTAQESVSYPILLNAGDAILESYRVRVYPKFVLIDESGVVVSVSNGLDLFLKLKIKFRFLERLL